MTYKQHFNTDNVYKAMFSRVIPRTDYKAITYPGERKRIVEWVLALAKKLKLSDNSA